MSKIKNGGLDQYCAGPFEQLALKGFIQKFLYSPQILPY